MRYVLRLTIAYLVIVIAGLCGDGKPDFSGNWTLNLAQSNFGKAPKPTGMTLKVQRDGDVMHSVQTNDSQGGPTYTEGNWYLDGKEHDTNGPAPGKSVTRWEGNTLYNERKSNDGNYVEKIWLSLSADGKTATERVVAKTPEGSNTSHLVWVRQ